MQRVRIARSIGAGVIGNETTPLLQEILHLDEDLLLQGAASTARGDSLTIYEASNRTLISGGTSHSSFTVFGSTVILIDPFGPHPVVITGSHNLAEHARAVSDEPF
jgi:hypothetical protein